MSANHPKPSLIALSVEQRARDLFAAELERDGIDFLPGEIRKLNSMLTMFEDRAIRAIKVALTQSRPEAELPELPRPKVQGTIHHEGRNTCTTGLIGFTADQMRAYGQQCAATRQDDAKPVAFARWEDGKGFDFTTIRAQPIPCIYPNQRYLPLYGRPADVGDDGEPDMFWDDADPEQQHNSIDELLNSRWEEGALEDGDTVTIMQGIHVPTITVRASIPEDYPDGSTEITWEALPPTPGSEVRP